MFSRSKTESAPMADLRQPSRREGGDSPSIISTGVVIKGDLSSGGDIQLDGTLEGDVRCAALTIGESGRVKGTIHADSLVVRGTIDGTVFSNTVRLDKSAQVTGDLTQRSIAIEAGAKITGHIIHRDKPLDVQAGAATATRTPASSAQSDRPGLGTTAAPGAGPSAMAKSVADA